MAAQRNGLLDRDRACVEILRGLTEVLGDRGVVIGGYAVSAWGRVRFSVDLDVVIHKELADGCREFLSGRGLTRSKPWDGGGVFAGESERWELGKGRFAPAA